jgi:hypothetical protein
VPSARARGTRRVILPVVKHFDWDAAKNANLTAERGIGFEEVVFHIERGDLLDIWEHPNRDRYAGQQIFVGNETFRATLRAVVNDEQSRLRLVSNLGQLPGRSVMARAYSNQFAGATAFDASASWTRTSHFRQVATRSGFGLVSPEMTIVRSGFFLSSRRSLSGHTREACYALSPKASG